MVDYLARLDDMDSLILEQMIWHRYSNSLIEEDEMDRDTYELIKALSKKVKLDELISIYPFTVSKGLEEKEKVTTYKRIYDNVGFTTVYAPQNPIDEDEEEPDNPDPKDLIILIRAKSDIKKGEELIAHYGMDEWIRYFKLKYPNQEKWIAPISSTSQSEGEENKDTSSEIELYDIDNLILDVQSEIEKASVFYNQYSRLSDKQKKMDYTTNIFVPQLLLTYKNGNHLITRLVGLMEYKKELHDKLDAISHQRTQGRIDPTPFQTEYDFIMQSDDRLQFSIKTLRSTRDEIAILLRSNNIQV